jgi:hypothetical protein
MNEPNVSSRPINRQPEKGYEDRPGWAACFSPLNPNSRATYVGVTVLDGVKHWVSVYLKTTRLGRPYASVHIQAFDR